METKKSKSQLNPKQAAVIKKVVEGKSQTKAYKEVYGTKDDDIAGASAARMLGNERVKSALQEALEKKGITADSIAETMLEIRQNRDWRAKDAFVDKAVKYTKLDETGDEKKPKSVYIEFE
jgi:hypothetical protein